MRQPVHIVASSLARIAGCALCVAVLPLAAGPLGFRDLDLLDVSQPIPDCGSCSFITSFQSIPLTPDPRASTVIIATMIALTVIALIGLRLRVRL